MEMNNNLLGVKSISSLIERLKIYVNKLQSSNDMDICYKGETISLMTELYSREDHVNCEGYSYLNYILLFLLRDDVTFFSGFQRNSILELKDMLFKIVELPQESLCPCLYQSSIRLLLLFYLEGSLNHQQAQMLGDLIRKNGDRELIALSESAKQHTSSFLLLSAAVVALSLFLSPLSLLSRLILSSLILIISLFMAFTRQKNHIKQLQHSIQCIPVVACGGKHVVLPPLLVKESCKHRQYLVDVNKPAQVQVGERIFESGEDALSTISTEIEASVKAEIKAANSNNNNGNSSNNMQKEETMVGDDVHERVSDLFTSHTERAIREHLNTFENQPFPVSASLRDDLVELIHILERNGENDELLQKTKEGLEFFDQVVVHRAVENNVENN